MNHSFESAVLSIILFLRRFVHRLLWRFDHNFWHLFLFLGLILEIQFWIWGNWSLPGNGLFGIVFMRKGMLMELVKIFEKVEIFLVISLRQFLNLRLFKRNTSNVKGAFIYARYEARSLRLETNSYSNVALMLTLDIFTVWGWVWWRRWRYWTPEERSSIFFEWMPSSEVTSLMKSRSSCLFGLVLAIWYFFLNYN